MKKFLIVFTVMFTCSYGFSQKGSSGSSTGLTTEQLGNMGIVNGCSDAKASNAQGRYDQIMNSSAQSSAYKQGYQQGWSSCRNSNLTYVWRNGKLVLVGPPGKRDTKARPCAKDFGSNIGPACPENSRNAQYQ